MKKTLSFLLLMATMLTGNHLLAQACKKDTLVINTGYNPVTQSAIAIGAADPEWQIVGYSADLLNPTKTTLPSVPVPGAAVAADGLGSASNPNSRWVSFYDPPGSSWTTWYKTLVPGDYHFTIKRNFKIVCSQTDLKVDIKISRDNYVLAVKIKDASNAVVWNAPLDAPLTTNVSSYYSSFQQIPVATIAGMAPGTYSIELDVYNLHLETNPLAENPHGVNIVGTLTSPSGNLLAPGSTSCDCECTDKCYWKVQGNNILNGNNIFGTLTNHDVRIFTNNQPVGIIKNTGRYGFGNMAPNNRVEITHGTAGNSGLRFTNLNSSSATTTNPGKVLSVDVNGDVVLVNNAGGGSGAANNGLTFNGTYAQLGQNCKDGSGAELLDDRAIPMNDHNIIFRDGKLQHYTNRVGIGIGSCIPSAKLEVYRNNEYEPYETYSKAISAVNADLAEEAAQGIYGEANNEQNPDNMGGYFTGINARRRSYGVLGIGMSNGGDEATGGWFTACGARRNIGVYGSACESYNQGNGPSYAGYFDGDVFSSGVFTGSDRSIKKNVESITGAMDILNKIQPKKYQFDQSKYPALHLSAAKENYGVIAQELEEVLPGLVKETPIPDGNKGFLKETIKAVNYTELIPILIQAVKDQQAEIETLKANYAKQGLGAAATTGKDGYLAQNVPNPFSVSTSIKYQLPAGTQKAVIGIYDMNGKEIRLFPLSAEKTGVVTIQGGDLKPGMYLYSLIVDGSYFDSKKMVLTSN